MHRRALRTVSLSLGVALVASGLMLGGAAHAAEPTPCTGGSINVVAHTDDDLLFVNPDIMRDIQAGRCTQTIFVTAGEAGLGEDYWSNLEEGIHASYAEMAGADNSWTEADDGVGNRDIAIQMLDGHQVSVAFIRLPDGYSDAGTPAYGNQSLMKLWNGSIKSITPVDGRPSYTKSQLQATILTMMKNSKATTVRTQNFTPAEEPAGDHSDHWVTAKLALGASKQYTAPHTLSAYEGYPLYSLSDTVSGQELEDKTTAFTTFSAYDSELCASGDGCVPDNYAEWLPREDIVAVQQTGNAATAQGTTVTASSQLSATQSAEKARDGYAWGAPQAPGHEWVSNNEGVGAWIRYAFPSATTVGSVTLFDRPTSARQITSAVLEFSDGSTVPVGALPDNGAGLTVTFPTRTVNGVTLKVTGVRGTTSGIGLAEFEVHTSTQAPAADVTPPVVSAAPAGGTYNAGQKVTLTANEAATIRYTLDGTDPSTSGTAKTYSQPIALAAGTQKLRYIATDTAGNKSAVAEQSYRIVSADTTPPTVTVDPAPGAYPAGQRITLTANEAATIYCTTDGSTPAASGAACASPLTLSRDTTLKYLAVDTAGNRSAVSTAAYTVKTAPNPSGPPSAHDFTGDGRADLLGANGADLALYRGDGAGHVEAAGTAATGWGTIDATITPGDFDGDGKPDVLARESDGALWLDRGTGNGTFGSGQQVGSGWDVMTAVTSAGDFNGDGNVDVLARAGDGALWLYPGDGTGGWEWREQVGTGWNVMSSIVGSADLTGDGNADVLAVDGSGTAWIYPGDGSGGWKSRVKAATGWSALSMFAAPGDLTGDGKADVTARDASGVLWIYPGDGTGGFRAKAVLGSGWSGFSFIG